MSSRDPILCFSHPDACYFAVGKIGKDQVEDYAKRREHRAGGARSGAGAGVQRLIVPSSWKAKGRESGLWSFLQSASLYPDCMAAARLF